MDYLNSVNLNAGSDFPFLLMDINRGKSIPEPPGFHVFHWHEDFQFILCYEGETYVHTLDHTYVVKAGNGIFLNKNVVHYVAGSTEHHYKSFLFPEHLVSFYQGSPAAKAVHRISECESLPVILLDSGIHWQKEIIASLQALAEFDAEHPAFYEYGILVQLSELWLTLTSNTTVPERIVKDETAKRMQTMLRYIEEHYSEDVSLEDIAGAAGISKSEAARCFKSSMQYTPYDYLIEYRLAKATEFLSKTDIPIGEISGLVGFNASSHFGKLFKKSTGLSPKDYRSAQKAKK